MQEESWDYARGKVTGPAVGLIVVCAISLVVLVFALMFDVWLLFSGTAARMEARGMESHQSAVLIRIVWGVLILITNVLILVGAVQMKGLRGRGFSRLACILALIPCLGPCFILGIPFGIWGLVVLNDPQVRAAFPD